MTKNSIFWLPGIIKKISILLFILSSVVFMTFIIGNYQGFLDSTQLMLLDIFEFIAIIFIIFGIYHGIFTIIKIIRLKSKDFLTLGFILSGEGIIISTYLLVKMISAVTQTVN